MVCVCKLKNWLIWHCMKLKIILILSDFKLLFINELALPFESCRAPLIITLNFYSCWK